jgi:hypothetical protein
MQSVAFADDVRAELVPVVVGHGDAMAAHIHILRHRHCAHTASLHNHSFRSQSSQDSTHNSVLVIRLVALLLLITQKLPLLEMKLSSRPTNLA